MINIGTNFNFYTYDYYPEPEVQDIAPIFYIKLKFPIGYHFSLSGSYEFETILESSEPFHYLKLEIRYDF